MGGTVSRYILCKSVVECVAEIQLEVKEMSDGMSTMTVADAHVAPKYDDPYEENPLAAKRLCNGVEERLAEVTQSEETSCDLASTDVCMEQGRSAALSDCGCSAVPVRSFELSAEYGGFFVASTVTEPSTDEPAQVSVRQTPVEIAAGFYDEPWDLSTVKHSIEAQLREKDVARSVADDCRPTTGDVYAQPNKAEKRQQRPSCSNTTDARVNDGTSYVNDGVRMIDNARGNDGPSYGILCERPAPALARRQPATRHNQPGTWATDCRPVDDYDIPWDQKKKLAGHTSKKRYFLSVP